MIESGQFGYARWPGALAPSTTRACPSRPPHARLMIAPRSHAPTNLSRPRPGLYQALGDFHQPRHSSNSLVRALTRPLARSDPLSHGDGSDRPRAVHPAFLLSPRLAGRQGHRGIVKIPCFSIANPSDSFSWCSEELERVCKSHTTQQFEPERGSASVLPAGDLPPHPPPLLLSAPPSVTLPQSTSRPGSRAQTNEGETYSPAA